MRRDGGAPAWTLAAALAAPLIGLGGPLLEVDDARYAQVPAEMAASGDWTVPTLDGMPYVEKPPLWYWTAAGVYRAAGVSEAAARAAMWLLALLGAAGAWWLGSWLYDPGTGRTAAAALASSSLWLFLTHNMTLDLPVSVFLLWTTALALRTMVRPEDARWAAPAAWLCAAAAFLSKGLIAVLLPALWTAGLALLFPKLRRGARGLLSPTGMLLAALIAVPWLLAVQRRRPDFLHVFFVEQHFQRYLTPKYNRGAPWWFFLAVLPAGLLPWTAPLLAGLARGARYAPRGDFRATALAAWVLGVAAFFSTSSSKLATYVLPAVPHAALLAASALDGPLPAWAAWLQRLLGAALLGAVAAAGGGALLGLLPASVWPPPGLPAASAPALAAFGAGALAALGAAMLLAPSLRRPARALALGGAVAGACLFPGLRAAGPLVSARELGTRLRDELRPGDEVWTYGTYLHGVPFYSRREVAKLVMFVGEFHYAKRDAAWAGRFGDDNDLRALPRPGGRTYVILRSFERPHAAATIGRGEPGTIESWREFGRWSVAVVRPR